MDFQRYERMRGEMQQRSEACRKHFDPDAARTGVYTLHSQSTLGVLNLDETSAT